MQEDDITKMLAATTHIGSDNSETTMEQYIFKKKTDGINIINLKKTWEKLVLAARAIAAVENPQVILEICHNTHSGISLMARCHVGLVMGATLNTFPPSLEFATTDQTLGSCWIHSPSHFTGVDDVVLIVLLRFSFQDVFVVASRPYAQRAVLKFAR